jgi:hypothetical protein
VKAFLFILLGLTCAVDAFAATKKDFKGLFGSYRRDRYTENEGRSTDFGMDLMLSTLIPVTNIVSSFDGTRPSDANSIAEMQAQSSPLNYATFFNVEGTFFFILCPISG